MRDVLNEIEKQKSQFGEHLQPPASEAQLLELKSKVRQELHVDVPKSYVSFLRRTNGLDWNGTVLFASDTAGLRDNPRIKLEGLVEANTRLREVPENSQFLILRGWRCTPGISQQQRLILSIMFPETYINPLRHLMNYSLPPWKSDFCKFDAFLTS